MTAKKVETETKVAIATGVGAIGQIIERSETFVAPKSLKGSWFVSESDSKAKHEAGEDALSDAGAGLTQKTPKEILDALPTMESAHINAFINAENAGQRRKKVITAAQDVLASRVGQIGGPDPAAKNPEEKDPISTDGTSVNDQVFE